MLLLSKVVSDPLVVSVPDAGHCDRKRSHANHAFRSWHKEVHYIKYLSTHIVWIMLECQRLAQRDIADVYVASVQAMICGLSDKVCSRSWLLSA